MGSVSMPIVVQCPLCKAKAKVKDEALGRSVRCPKCGEAYKAEALPSSEPAAATDRPAASPRRAPAPPELDFEERPPARGRRPGRDEDDVPAPAGEQDFEARPPAKG